MKTAILSFLLFPFFASAQNADCTFKPPTVTIHFGSGNVRDLNAEPPDGYQRRMTTCPTDGYYAYTAFTSNCFNDDWLTLAEDHTPGDAAGNMLLVNASWNSGAFLKTSVNGLKGNTVYEFGVWLMNVCKPSDKCPFPLLPVILIRLQTPDGKTIAQFSTGELQRQFSPQWIQHRAQFTMPASTPLLLTLIDNSPGGCGNDFALDDITFRECVKPQPAPPSAPAPPALRKPKPAIVKSPSKQPPARVHKKTGLIQTAKPSATIPNPVVAAPNRRAAALPPPVLTTRENPLIKQIETEAGEIKLDLYDNGEIDGDTVSIYHNNVLLVSRVALSQKPVSFRIAIDDTQPRHELVMVAENLGSIPPNTSLLIVTTAAKRYEVFISSTAQKNARLVFVLKK